MLSGKGCQYAPVYPRKLLSISTQSKMIDLAAVQGYARHGDAIVVVSIDRLGRNIGRAQAAGNGENLCWRHPIRTDGRSTRPCRFRWFRAPAALSSVNRVTSDTCGRL